MSSNAQEPKTLSLGANALSLSTYGRKLIDGAIKHGGCTLNTLAYQANIPNNGYVVGGASNTLTIPVKDFSGHTQSMARKQVYDWLNEHIDSDGLPPYPFVGSWVEENLIYFDFCNILYHRNEALNLARYRGELAIYDQASGESIYL